MDWTNRHPADQLALKAASLLATSSPRPASAAQPKRQAGATTTSPENQSWVGGEVCGGACASTHEPKDL